MFVMLSIVSLTPSIAASAAPPCSTATMGVSLGVRSNRGKFLSRKNLAQVVKATLDLRNMQSVASAGRGRGPLTWLDVLVHLGID